MKQRWCIPRRENGEFVARMEDVLEVYHRPYDPLRPVICIDETSKELHGDVRAPLPPRPASEKAPAQPAREDYEYERHGTANLFIAFEPLLGKRRIKVTDRRTKQDYARFIGEVVEEHPEAECIVIVEDNLNTHTLGALYETFEPLEARRIAAKLEIHYTPKHGSWLNMAEIEFSVLGRQCLDRRIPDRETLQTEVAAWGADRDGRAAKMVWRFTTTDARIKLKHLYPTLQP